MYIDKNRIFIGICVTLPSSSTGDTIRIERFTQFLFFKKSSFFFKVCKETPDRSPKMNLWVPFHGLAAAVS